MKSQQADQSNQFMSNRSGYMNQMSNSTMPKNPQQMQKFMSMFQQMMANPSNFMKMMTQSQYQAQTQMANSQNLMNNSNVNNMQYQNLQDSGLANEHSRRRQFQVQQHKYRNYQISPRKAMQSSQIHNFPKKNTRQKGQDVLGRYLPPQQQQQTQRNEVIEQKYLKNHNSLNQMAQSFVTVTSNQHDKIHTVNPYDEKPIQSKYIDEIKQSKVQQGATNNMNYNNFDEMPIRPAQGLKYNINDENGFIKNESAIDPNKYIQAENRPITGIKGDFKTFLKNQEGIDFQINNDQQQQGKEVQEGQQQNKKTKPFLKRGSRQYLSSAKDKSASKIKTKKKTNAENLDMSSSRIKDNQTKRSISQNRVLGGAKKSRNQKSITKLPNKNVAKDQKNNGRKDMVDSHRQDTRKQSVSPKFNESKKTVEIPKPQKQIQKAEKVQKKKIKNIFKGSSSSQSDDASNSNENQNKFRSSYSSGYNAKKIQVISGVFLTKKQLHEILTKYSSANQQSQQSEQKKLKELKKKYIDLCNLLAEQKQIFEQQMLKEKQQFQAQKQMQLQKIKNQRKVQERNMVASRKQKEKQKQREQFQIMRKQFEREKEEMKKKDKNNRIIIDKYKKQLEQMKMKMSNLEGIPNRHSEHVSTTSQKAQSKASAINKQKPPIKPKQQTKQSKPPKSDFASSSEKPNIDSFNNNYNQQSPLPNYNQIKNDPQFTGMKKYTNQPVKINNNASKTNQQPKKLTNTYHEDEDVQAQGNQNQYSDQQDDYNNKDNQSDDDKQQIVEYNQRMKLQDLTKIPLSIKMVTPAMINNMFRSQYNPQYLEYKKITAKNRTKIHTSRNAAQRKLTNIYADGGKQVIFETGVRKQYFSNGYSIVVFNNGDIKQKLSDGTVFYFYYEKEVDQITLTNGINIYRFDNNQVQIHFQDGSVQIRHPDGTFKAM